MSRAVLCEGKRDVRLLKRFYERRDRPVSFDTFHGERHESSELKSVEGNELRRFTGRRNDDDVFLKSEGGVEELKPLFVRLARSFFYEWQVDVCLVVDLDERDHDRWDETSDTDRYDDLVSDLDERVGGIHGSQSNVEHEQFYRKGRHVLASSMLFDIERHEPTAFDVLAFRTSLEDAAEIADGDDESTENEKLDELLSGEGGETIRRVL